MTNWYYTIKVNRWLAKRKKAGRKIDPGTAEVMWAYAQTLDPYGVEAEMPDEYYQVGMEYFARSPGSDIWVWFGDLPAAVSDALWEKHKANLAFPADLPAIASGISQDSNGHYVIQFSEAELQQALELAEQKQAGKIGKGFINCNDAIRVRSKMRDRSDHR